MYDIINSYTYAVVKSCSSIFSQRNESEREVVFFFVKKERIDKKAFGTERYPL